MSQYVKGDNILNKFSKSAINICQRYLDVVVNIVHDLSFAYLFMLEL